MHYPSDEEPKVDKDLTNKVVLVVMIVFFGLGLLIAKFLFS